MSRRKRALVYIVILIVIFGAAVIYANQKREKPVVVRTTTAQTGKVNAYLSTTGTVESKNTIQYYGLQAKINRVFVQVGDKVSKGAALITYDISDLNTAVKQAKIQYDNAVLQRDDLYSQNNTIKDKIKELDNTISKLEASTSLQDQAKLETYKQQRGAMSTISTEKLKLSNNAVSLAKLAYTSARQRLSDNKGTIRATQAGVITAINAQQGSVGSMMQPAVVVQDIDSLNVTVSLGKYDANKVEQGQQVTIRNGDKSYKGRVSAIGLVATRALPQGGNDASLDVTVDVLDKNTNLKIAFDVDVDILTGRKTGVLTIPAECIKPDKNNRDLVYVVNDGLVQEKIVKLGLRSDTLVEVQTGISEGEKLVLNPSASITNGVKVKEE